ncbi:MAG: hypothetical protein Q8O55_06170 [Dehalococcoidales bacterium]|nr:hypothetical protein [Dehalococcoidales bacterium]
MRKLYLVPILHMSADMGTLAASLDETAKAELGQEIWEKHKDDVSRFWDCIAHFFDVLDVEGFKIYQDGMVADGVDGLRIIREGINQGSKNYAIIGKLLERGAILVKTEDLGLVKQEYTYVAKIAHARSKKEKDVWAIRYKRAQGGLLKQRDDFIAKRIRETLGEGETGILFIGAYHNILSRLPEDIQVLQDLASAKLRGEKSEGGQ